MPADLSKNPPETGHHHSTLNVYAAMVVSLTCELIYPVETCVINTLTE